MHTMTNETRTHLTRKVAKGSTVKAHVVATMRTRARRVTPVQDAANARVRFASGVSARLVNFHDVEPSTIWVASLVQECQHAGMTPAQTARALLHLARTS